MGSDDRHSKRPYSLNDPYHDPYHPVYPDAGPLRHKNKKTARSNRRDAKNGRRGRNSKRRRRQRQRIYERDGYKCVNCDRTQEDLEKIGEVLTLDHIVPISRGGKHGSNNLQTLCGPCNQEKADTHEDDEDV